MRLNGKASVVNSEQAKDAYHDAVAQYAVDQGLPPTRTYDDGDW